MSKERLAANLAEADFDPEANTLSGMASLFGSMIITSVPTFMFPSAFKKTIKERFSSDTRKNKVRILWQHQETEPIGIPLSLKETPEGLQFKAKIIETQRGQDALKLLRAGAISELSIGFDSLKQDIFDGRRAAEVLDKKLANPYNHMSEDEKRTLQSIRSKVTEYAATYPVFRFVYEVRLWEISLVSWGADSETYVSEVHNAQTYTVTDSNNTVNWVATVPRGTYNVNELREVLANQFFNHELGYDSTNATFSIGSKEKEESTPDDLETFTIVKRGSKYCLISKSTGKTLGCHPTKDGAIKQEQAIKANQHSGVDEDRERAMLIDKYAMLESIRTLAQMVVELCAPKDTSEEASADRDKEEAGMTAEEIKECRMRVNQIATTTRAILELCRMPLDGEAGYASPAYYADNPSEDESKTPLPDEKHIGKKISGKRMSYINQIQKTLEDLISSLEDEVEKVNEETKEQKETKVGDESFSDASKGDESPVALEIDTKIQEAEARLNKLIGIPS